MALGEKNLPQMKSSFKYVAPVAVCYNNTQPYVEKSYTYPVSRFAIDFDSLSLILIPRSLAELQPMDGWHYLDLARCSYCRLHRRFSLDPSLDWYLIRRIGHKLARLPIRSGWQSTIWTKWRKE